MVQVDNGVPVSLHYLVGEAASIGAFVGAFFNLLPMLAAGMAAVWYGVLIYESLERRRLRRKKKSHED